MPQLKIEDIGKCYTCIRKNTLLCPRPMQAINNENEGCREWEKDKTENVFFPDFTGDYQNGKKRTK